MFPGRIHGRGVPREPQLPIGETRPPARRGRVIFFNSPVAERLNKGLMAAPSPTSREACRYVRGARTAPERRRRPCARIVTPCIVTPPVLSPSSPATVSPLRPCFHPLYCPPPPFTGASQGCDRRGDDTGVQPVPSIDAYWSPHAYKRRHSPLGVPLLSSDADHYPLYPLYTPA
eukprot:1184566-Prorocentrum_minimum.AAC.7